jgi:hypothetical protein
MPACLLTEKYDVPTAYRTFSSASCFIFPRMLFIRVIDWDGSLLHIASYILSPWGRISLNAPTVNDFPQEAFAPNSK